MIVISKHKKRQNNNQSESNSRLISKNEDIVSTESSLKKIVDVGEDEENIYGKLVSDNSHTISYDNLKYGDKTSDKETSKQVSDNNPTAENKTLQKRMYKNTVRENNLAQIEQGLTNTETSSVDTADTTYVPPLQARGDYNNVSLATSSTLQPQENNLVSTDSRMSDLVHSTSVLDVDNTSKTHTASGFKKNAKLKQLKALKESKYADSFTSTDSGSNYSVISKQASFTQTDGKVTLDSNTSNNLSIGSSFSKTNTDKVLSSAVYAVKNDTKPLINSRYKNIVKRHQRDITSDNNKSYTVSNSQHNTATAFQPSLSTDTQQAFGNANVSIKGEISGSPKLKNNNYKKYVLDNALRNQRQTQKKTVLTVNKPNSNAKKPSDNALKFTPKPPPSMKELFSKSSKELLEKSNKIYNATGNELYRIARNTVATASEDNYEVKAVNAMFTIVDTAKNVKATYKTAVKVVRAGADTIKMTKNAVKMTKKTVQLVKRLKKMNFKQIKKFGKIKARMMARQLKNIAMVQSKAMLAAALAFGCFILIFMLFVGSIFAMLSTFFWNTENTLDTTQLVKYISSLDADMQNTWWKGKTASAMEEHNDSSRKYFYCYYYLAKDQLPDTLPEDTSTLSSSDLNCFVKYRFNSDGGLESFTNKGYTLVANSMDEMLEEYRWTTDDYISALAYLQIQNENLGWVESVFGWVGERTLKSKAKELHQLTYNNGNQIYVIEDIKRDKETFSEECSTIIEEHLAVGDDEKYYYFGRKNSVRFIIENDLLPTPLTDDEKERFEYICKYGNSEIAILNYPLDGNIDIAKHFGEQQYLKFNPAEDAESYPSVSKDKGYHYAVDLNASKGDIIKAPFSGYCKTSQQSNRGFEYVISTSPDFEDGQSGYLCRITCSSATYVSSSEVTEVVSGQKLGIVAGIEGVNTKKPTGENDVFADKLYPCGTNTEYYTCTRKGGTTPAYSGEYVHLELYKLPCDFTSAEDMEKNVLAPELCFIYPDPDVDTESDTETTTVTP